MAVDQHLLVEEWAEQATGVLGAGDYKLYALSQGYPHIKVIDWTSSAGDWTFIVSKDGQTWFPMYQMNRYPRPGFSRYIDEENGYDGPSEEAIDYFSHLL